jgi:hypothetical protein
MKLEERLNEIIEEKDTQIEELQEKIEKLELQSDLQKLEYQMHEYFKETDLQKKLPVPRLEMRFSRLKNHRGDDNWYNVCWKYGIVYKHYAETHNDTMLFIPISQTTSNGGDGTFNSHFHDGRLDTPFRDGVHIYADSKLFDLPAFIICEEKNISQKIELDMDISQQLSKMVRS